MLILAKASCHECAKETHAFEGHACDTYRALRRSFKFPSRNRGANSRERVNSERFRIILDNNRELSIPTSEYPGSAIFRTFPLPGILAGLEPEDKPLTGEFFSLFLPDDWHDIHDALKKKYNAKTVQIPPIGSRRENYTIDYGRMLAKIGHSFAVSQLGLENFFPFLTRCILKKEPYNLPYYIGSPEQGPSPPRDLHEISLIPHENLVIVALRLLAAMGGPTHFVVVGKFNR